MSSLNEHAARGGTVAPEQLLETQRAFDSVAPDYDGPRGNNALIQRMRTTLWDTVAAALPVGSRLIDLAAVPVWTLANSHVAGIPYWPPTGRRPWSSAPATARRLRVWKSASPPRMSASSSSIGWKAASMACIPTSARSIARRICRPSPPNAHDCCVPMAAWCFP